MPDPQQNPGMLASLLCLVVGPAIASPLVWASNQVVRGPAKILDGDTLVVAGEHVRLLGLDAPEDGQTCQAAGQEWPCGDAAGAALSSLITGHPLYPRVGFIVINLTRPAKRVVRSYNGRGPASAG